MWNVQFSNGQNSITFVNYLKRMFLTHPQGKKKKNDVPRLEVVLIAKAQQNKDQNSAGLGLLWTLNYGEASIQAVDPTEQNHLTCH